VAVVAVLVQLVLKLAIIKVALAVLGCQTLLLGKLSYMVAAEAEAV
jgi:hypothetical protein